MLDFDKAESNKKKVRNQITVTYVSPSRVPVLLRPLLPSACYAGYHLYITVNAFQIGPHVVDS